MTTIRNSEGKPHFATLDGLRGIAALAVVIMHWLDGLGYKAFGSSHLAVDFFFMLSGFVVAYSYEERLKKGFSFFKFMLLRIIRLYPMIILGALLGFSRFEGKTYYEAGQFSLEYVYNLLMTLLMLPENILRFDSKFEFFQLNIAFWSLFCEFVVYIFFGLVLFRLNKLALFAVSIIASIGVCFWFKASFGAEGTLVKAVMAHALSRVLFSFTLGVLICRFRDTIKKWTVTLPVSYLLLLPLFFALNKNILPWYIYSLLAIVILPTSIMIGISQKFEGVIGKILNFLGEISYPVYAIHTPIIWGMGFAVKKLTGITEPAQLVWFGLIILPVTIGLSYLALKLYDEPVRRFLKNKFKDYLTQK